MLDEPTVQAMRSRDSLESRGPTFNHSRGYAEVTRTAMMSNFTADSMHVVQGQRVRVRRLHEVDQPG